MKLIIDGNLLPKIIHKSPIDNGNSYELECALPCVYIDSKDAVREQILDISQSELLNGWKYSDKLNLAVVALKKREPFLNEEEIRYIRLYPQLSRAYYNEGNFYYEENPEPCANEYQVDLEFPKELLLGIEVGKEASQEQLTYVRQHLIDCGYDPRKVHITQAK